MTRRPRQTEQRATEAANAADLARERLTVSTATGAVTVQDPSRNHRVIVQGQIVHPDSTRGRELSPVLRYASGHDDPDDDGVYHRCTLRTDLLELLWKVAPWNWKEGEIGSEV